MRVMGGQWRGRRLVAVPGRTARPTTGRVREALFSMLGSHVEAATVVDLCCGAGALGIEALSRGAARAVFVDVSSRALEATRANLEHCGAGPERWTLTRDDAVRWLERGAAAGRGVLVLADPPYDSDLASRLVAALLRLAPGGPLLAAAIEHGASDGRVPAAPPAGCPWRLRCRRYGRAALTLVEEA